MKNKINFLVAIFLFCLVVIPSVFLTKIAKASGVNSDNIYINVYTEQGDDWFRAMKKSTDSHSTLNLKKLLPGKYRLEIADDDDVTTPQTIDVKAQMYDEKGRKFDEKIDVTAYIYIDTTSLPAIVKGDDKVLVGVYETDSDGVVTLEGILPDFDYKIEVDDEAHVGKKANRPRVQVKAKIDDSDWFDSEYKRTDTTNTLYLTDVIPGKYKFKYKSGDVANISQPFNLYIRLRDDKGKKIRKEKTVTIYAYINKQKVLVGKFKTTKDGKLYLPNVVPMEYKLEVD